MFSAATKTDNVSSAANFIEDVFSTYLYTGTSGSNTITNGIDLSTKGGLVWVKSRSGASSSSNHILQDTVRGVNKQLRSNTTGAEGSDAVNWAFNSSGFSMNTSISYLNDSGTNYASWTFREQPKFFDVVTYTGTGGGPSSVAHALNSVPGCVIIKSTSRTGNWVTVSRMSTGNYAAFVGSSSGLQSTAAADSTTYNLVGAGAVTSTTFDPSWWNANGTVGAVNNICDNGVTYVAYLFAHDAGGFGLTGTDNVISCGSLTQNASGNATVTLGYEPQYLLLKKSSGIGDWIIFDTMRGWCVTANPYLLANTSDAEAPGTSVISPTATGFQITAWDSNTTYIYIAIRRGPMKTPTSGTSVFSPNTYTGTGATLSVSGISFPPDLVIPKWRSNGGGGYSTRPGALYDKLRGAQQELAPTSSAAESTQSTGLTSFNQSGFTIGTSSVINSSPDPYISWNFLRAPGFFDEVCYTGTGVTDRVVNHNLTVVPEMMIVKIRNNYTPGIDASGNWAVYHAALGNQARLQLNLTNSVTTGTGIWFSTTPTATTFKTSADDLVNKSASGYVAYLFATCPGVSKVGSYTGTGALQTINCGFAAGARFVLIKRVDSTGDWYVWDSARGISSGNDPYLLLNSTAAEVTGTNYVDTTAVGFQVTAAAPGEINANGGTFIFLAIA